MKDKLLQSTKKYQVANEPTHIVLYTEVDAQCDKQTKVIGRTSIVASVVNIVPPMTAASLSH